jgi:hypothetical protein
MNINEKVLKDRSDEYIDFLYILMNRLIGGNEGHGIKLMDKDDCIEFKCSGFVRDLIMFNER